MSDSARPLQPKSLSGPPLPTGVLRPPRHRARAYCESVDERAGPACHAAASPPRVQGLDWCRRPRTTTRGLGACMVCGLHANTAALKAGGTDPADCLLPGMAVEVISSNADVDEDGNLTVYR